MELFQVLESRHSVRVFSDAPVTTAQRQAILDAARLAPSAGGLQSWCVYDVVAPVVRERLAQAAYGQNEVALAPLVLVFCAEPSRSGASYGARGESLFAIQDATIACVHAQLAATALGLASVWVGAFDEEAVRQTIEAPHTVRPIAILPIGQAAAPGVPAPHRPLDELVHRVG